MRKLLWALCVVALDLGIAAASPAVVMVDEAVYVESPTDTDSDGVSDRIYVRITRPAGAADLPVIYTISPYALGGNNVGFHDVNVNRLPQDEPGASLPGQSEQMLRDKRVEQFHHRALQNGYATVRAHSLGTGYSSGCPTIGDEAETLAAKAVIDWLNGRARAFKANGTEVQASWASGAVGMTGVSYNGTLPNMVAATGVEGLRAIIPVAAISNWYDYYRANGLVVGPGGYVGEDADILARFVVRSGACSQEIQALSEAMGREHGDFDSFWQARDYVSRAANVRAAVFIIHGQSDWNVRQRHAIEWWHALEGIVPRRMWLHRGGHGYPSRADTNDAIWAWFDQFVKGEDNGVLDAPPVEVQSRGGTWTTQLAWPNEQTAARRFHLTPGYELVETATAEGAARFVDRGRQTRLETLVKNPTTTRTDRLAFVTAPLSEPVLLSGTPWVSLQLSVENRRAANITVALVEYRGSSSTIITRGWADPQNHHSVESGELLAPGEKVSVSFDLEPKQHLFATGSRIGLVVTATDYDHTLRPGVGTEIELSLGADSFVDLSLSGDR